MSKIMRGLYAEARAAMAKQEAAPAARQRKRYSIDPDDPGYLNHRMAMLKCQETGQRVAVYLDGQKVERAFMADEAQGVVGAYVHPFVVLPSGDLKTEELTGTVEVRFE